MPLYQCAIEIENGRTASENGMMIEGQQEENLTVGNQHTLQSNHGRWRKDFHGAQ